ncbi:DNA excision repair protein ERCC-1 [Blastomyces dermatitidis ER-3]|uniref:DNA excision repair protein ERCC-1 n=1 Tax=Ajellomyces dermatitidis (strain ER-3 / ATCC MYA-2586) TaxID=559297 RepID=A0ABP2EN85_AJEDR|nr:DNA excision repair protein ERCC-1 [Blastomyces dermatitidis ER-3]EEQ83549.1 DNA excision repair protein ERCC-1 [Blastomyces dermatitidis ER-3]
MDDDFGDIPEFDELLQPNKSDKSLPRSAAPTTSDQRPKVQQPKPQALPSRSGPSAILVSARQRGNPILNHVRHIPWEYADIPADYVVGSATCVLFLSLKYYRLHPEYIYARIKGLAGKYNLRILLTLIDIPNHEDSLRELSKTSIVNNLTLILCWSAAEAGHYLELFKSCEHAQPTAIRTQQSQSYNESLVEFITAPRSINKSDAASLISTFGSLQAAVNAQPEQISAVPGWGERKVQQWHDAVTDDFQIRRTAKRRAKPPIDNTREARTLEEDFTEEESAFLAAHNEEIDRDAPRRLSANAGRQIHKNQRKGLNDTELENLPSKEDESESSIRRSDQHEEQLNDGVMAALAKLRENGG